MRRSAEIVGSKPYSFVGGLVRVFLVSPFRAATDEDRERNLAYLRAALADCSERGEAPFASHAIYTQCLDDNKVLDREKGFEMAAQWHLVAKKTVIYRDLGISDGMNADIRRAEELGQVVEYRTLEGWD